MTGPYPIPDAALAQHIAFVGKTGSGKTSSAKTAVEHLVAQGARVCVLDPIKSDWWGITSSADGKKAGLPFQILGGPYGHVPLHETSGAAIGELVARGELPLSIIDMKLFGMGGLARFFTEFAPALMNNMRGVVHLVMEEAHLFAPKERAGTGGESLSTHWANRLATAGRSEGVRLIVATQRTQSLHNAILGSCETLVAHRLGLPADQKPVVDWLKANAQRDIMLKVSEELASLPTGTGWLCSGELKLFERIAFPKITTFDNSATPTGELADRSVKTAPVDVQKLRAVIGEAVVAADANDPKKLKELIAQLRADLAAKPPPAAGADPASLAAAKTSGYNAGYECGRADERQASSSEAADRAWQQVMGDVQHRLRGAFDRTFIDLRTERAFGFATSKPSTEALTAAAKTPTATPGASNPAEAATAPMKPHPAAARFAAACACYRERGLTQAEVATVAGMKPGNGYFYGARKSAIAQGLVEERDGRYFATGPGAKPPSRRDIFSLWSKLKKPAISMLENISEHGPLTNEALAAWTGLKPGNGFWYGGLAALRDAGLIETVDGHHRLTPLVLGAPP